MWNPSLSRLGCSLLVVLALAPALGHRSASAQDGNLYLMSDSYNGIWRFSGSSGAALPALGKSGAVFVDPNSGNLGNCRDMAFGPDQRLYAVGAARNEVLRFDQSTGAFFDIFVANNSNGIYNLEGIVFGPDGHLYLVGELEGKVWRFNGQTGAPLPAPGKSGAIFVQDQGEHFGNARDLAFGPNGHLYVVGAAWNGVLEYDSAGSFVREIVTNNAEGIANLISLSFGPDGHLYLMAGSLNGVYRFDGSTGAAKPAFGQTGAVFIDGNVDGLNGPTHFDFDVSGDLFAIGSGMNAVLRYDHPSGAFVSYFVPNNAEGILNLRSILVTPHYLTAVEGEASAPPSVRAVLAPNPAQASCRIEYTLASRSVVNISTFDVRGRLVATIHHATEAAGAHTATWDGRTRSGALAESGVYFLRVLAGPHSEVRKIVLAR